LVGQNLPTLSLSLLLFAACSPSQRAQTGAAPSSIADQSALKAPQSGAALESTLAQNVAQPDAQSSAVPAAKPQLIKTASLRLTVQDVDGAIGDLRNLLKQHQGDIYNFIVGGPVNQNTFGQQVQDRWNRSTRGASQLMIGLMLLGIGLIPFLPFLLLLGVGLYILRRQIKRGKQRALRRPSTIVPPDVD
jgi:hypothetical protein